MPVAATGGGNASYGRITVVKRNGQDSAFFELKYKDYLFGRASHCDVCIQLETIAEEHCRVFQDAEGKAVIENVSSLGLVVNGSLLGKHERHVLQSGDLFTIVERSFRYEIDGGGVAAAVAAVTPKKSSAAIHGEADLMHFSPRKVGTPSKMKESPMMPPEPCDTKDAVTPPAGDLSTPRKKGAKATPATPLPLVEETTTAAEIEDKANGCAEEEKSATTAVATPLAPIAADSPMEREEGVVATPTKTPAPQPPASPQLSLPRKALGTPQRVASPSPRKTPAMGTPLTRVLASPGRTIGSPQRTLLPQTPGKTEATTPSKTETATPLVDAPTTPSAQLEGGSSSRATAAAPSTGRSVSKFTLEHTMQVDDGGATHRVDAGSSPVVMTPKQATPGALLAAPGSAHSLCTPPPRSGHGSSPNVNLLFPPTPALAAAAAAATTTTTTTPVGTPRPSIVAAASSPARRGETPRSPAVVAASEASFPGTPRSPRFSVASTGSPIVVDGEIRASPKVGRVEFFDRPQFASGDGVIVEEQVEAAIVTDNVQETSGVLVEVETGGAIEESVVQTEHHLEAATMPEITAVGLADELAEQEEAEPETPHDEPVFISEMTDGESALEMVRPAGEEQAAALEDTSGEKATAEGLPEMDDAEMAPVDIQEAVVLMAEETQFEALATSNAVGAESEAVVTETMDVQEELEQSVQPLEESDQPPHPAASPEPNVPSAEAALPDDTTTEANDDGTAATLSAAESGQPSLAENSTPSLAENSTPSTAENSTPSTAENSTPSTPRRPARAAAAKTPATAPKTMGKAGAASEPRRSTRSTTTPAKTPATSKIGKRTRGVQQPQSSGSQDEEQVSGGPAASVRRSTRKTLAAKTPAPPSTGKRAATQGRQATTEEYSEGDSASPSYRSRGKPGKADATAGSLGSADDAENAHPNKIARRHAGPTPAKQVIVEIAPASDSPADNDESSRRRSTRARTPAKAQ